MHKQYNVQHCLVLAMSVQPYSEYHNVLVVPMNEKRLARFEYLYDGLQTRNAMIHDVRTVRTSLCSPSFVVSGRVVYELAEQLRKSRYAYYADCVEFSSTDVVWCRAKDVLVHRSGGVQFFYQPRGHSRTWWRASEVVPLDWLLQSYPLSAAIAEYATNSEEA